MHPLRIHCGACRRELAVAIDAAHQDIKCPVCETRMEIHAFPALLRPTANDAPERALVAGESTCFHHPQNRAAVACDECGRFLCTLCDLGTAGSHLCPQCFAHRPQGAEGAVVESVRYDQVALLTAILPVFFFPVTLITAPLTLYLVVRHWRVPAPRQSVGRRVALVTAALVALAQIGGWFVLLAVILLGAAYEW